MCSERADNYNWEACQLSNFLQPSPVYLRGALRDVVPWIGEWQNTAGYSLVKLNVCEKTKCSACILQ